MSQFSDVQQGQPIEVFQVNQAYNDDKDSKKVNLSIGAFRTNESKPWILPVVKKVESILVKDIIDESINHEYFPITGLEGFCHAATSLLLGKDNALIKERKAQGIQCLSGTGSLREAIEFLREVMGATNLYISNPSWGNHKLMGKYCHYKQVKEYRYWDGKTRTLDFKGMVEDLQNAPDKSVVIVHGCAHNPTGVDPTPEQWKILCHIFKEKNLYLIFDVAYQGFASGSLDNDAYAVRLFVSEGIELFVAQSFAKNFGLYNERIGNLTIVTRSAQATDNIKSQIKVLIRANYSNPPQHGARIVQTILDDPTLYGEWKNCVEFMAKRIIDIRGLLRKGLEDLNTPGNWEHITSQIGMFGFTGLTVPQVEYLKEKWHIYMLKNGRISLCGLTSHNVSYVAFAINDAVNKFPEGHGND